jgi:hypothetical protein
LERSSDQFSLYRDSLLEWPRRMQSEVSLLEKIVVEIWLAESREHFGDPEEEKRPPLETVTRGL